MALEVSEDVLHHERLEPGCLQGREAARVGTRIEEGRRRREQMVEVPPLGVVDRFDVGHTAVAGEQEVLDVARSAADPLERFQSSSRGRGLHVGRRLEVVQQVELEVVDDCGWHFVARDVAVDLESRVGNRRSFDLVQLAVEDHAGGSHDLPLGAGLREVWVGRVQAHLVAQRADDELSDRDRLAVRKKRSHAQVRIDPLHARRVDGSGRGRRDGAVRDSLGDERLRDRAAQSLGGAERGRAHLPEIRSDLVREHLSKAQAEEVRRVAAVRARHDVSPGAGRSARAPMAAGAAVGQPRADGDRRVDVPEPVVHGGALELGPRELALKELAAPPDRPEGVPADQEGGGLRGRPVAPARSTSSASDLAIPSLAVLGA